MNWPRQLRIGYAPYSDSLDFPGDRRRFCFYASKRNIPYEIARAGNAYDAVVVTEGADITFWARYPKGRTRIIFDFPDSYLSVPRLDAKGMLRGLAKFAVRQTQRLSLNYRTALEDMCGRADAVVCCTAEQQARIRPFCANAHIILDAHFNVVRCHKEDYSAGEVFHFVWEGLAHNLEHLLEIREVLRDLRRKRPFVIHAITELQYRKYLGRKIGKRNTVDEARRIWPGIQLYAWNEHTFSSIVRCCDLALVPIPLRDPFCAEKPENRLVLFWRAGMPVLGSATAAHRRAMHECGLEMAPANLQEWREALDYYTSNEQARKHAGQSGRSFAETEHSEQKWLHRWDHVFANLLDDAGSASRLSPQRSEDRWAGMPVETAGHTEKPKG